MAEGLRRLKPDVVCLQEAWPDAAERLAAMGLHVGSAIGDHSTNIVATQAPAVFQEMWLSGDDGLERRSVIRASFEQGGTEWVTGSCHLAWGVAESIRLDQAREIDSFAEKQPGTVVVAGDLNCLPQSATVRYLTGLDLARDGQSSTLWIAGTLLVRGSG